MPMRLRHYWPLILLVSVTAHSASFDCTKASTANEKHICANPALSDLDEHYNKLYKAAKRNKSQNKQALTTLKNEAISAFKSREQYCSDQLCLVSWYQNRISALSGKLKPSTPPLSISELYHSLDLRTLRSSFGPRLKVDCKSFLADYFPPSSLRDIDENRVTMEYDDRIFVLEVRGENLFHHQDIITNASYRKDGELTVSYAPDSKAWIADYKGFDLPERCLRVEIPWPNLKFSRTVTAPKYMENMPTFKDFADSGTAGEISLMHLGTNQQHGNNKLPKGTPYFVDTPVIYDSINGNKIGVLLTTLTYSEYDHNYASVQFLPYSKNVNSEPLVILRPTSEPTLLFFEETNQWVNVSSNPDKALWMNLADSPNWATLFKSRDQVIKESTKILVRSAHNLRSEPSTGSDVIHVLSKDNNADILPLKIMGDWMKVHYVSPSPDPRAEEIDFVSLKSLGPEYKQIQGWIKFRNSPTEELVNILYDEHYPVSYDFSEFTPDRF